MSKNIANRQRGHILRGTHRSAAIGTDHSTRFYVDMGRDVQLYVDKRETGDQAVSLLDKVNGPDQKVKDSDQKVKDPDQPTLKPKPKRFENYSPKKTTKEEIEEKQRIAAERKQKHDESRIQQAKKVSQQAIRFDKGMKQYLDTIQKQEGQKGSSDKKWFSSAMKFK